MRKDETELELKYEGPGIQYSIFRSLDCILNTHTHNGEPLETSVGRWHNHI